MGKREQARFIKAIETCYDIVPEDQWCPNCSDGRVDFLIISDDGEHVHCSRCGEDYEL